MIQVYEVGGTYNVFGAGGVEPFVFGPTTFDSTKFTWTGIPYPGELFPMNTSVATGFSNLVAAINATPGPFALIGTSQGAIVTGNVYDELRSGGLQDRRADLLGAVTFGNPRRQEGHTFPNCPDPGGHGAFVSDLLTDTEELWWDIARPEDDVTCTPDGPVGDWLGAIFDLFMQKYDGNLLSALGYLFQTPLPAGVSFLQALMDVYRTVTVTHSYFTYQPLPGDSRTAIQVASDYISSLG